MMPAIAKHATHRRRTAVLRLAASAVLAVLAVACSDVEASTSSGPDEAGGSEQLSVAPPDADATSPCATSTSPPQQPLSDDAVTAEVAIEVTPDGDSTFVIEELMGSVITDLVALDEYPCGEGLERQSGPFEPEIAGEIVRARPVVDGDVQRTGYFTRCRRLDGDVVHPSTLFYFEEPVDERPPNDTDAQIAQDLQSIVTSFDDCLRQMPNCDAGGPGRWRTGTQFSLTEQQIATWNANGYHVRDIESRAFSILDTTIDDDGVAAVTVCETDSSVVYVPASATSPEQIIDDESVRLQQTWLLVQEDGRWQATDIVDRTIILGELCEHEEA